MNQTKSWWPVWIPYPSSWLRVLSLFPLLPGAALTAIWPFIILAWHEENSPSAIALLYIIPVILLSILLYTEGRHWLQSQKNRQPPRWFPHRTSWWAGFYAVLVLNVTLVVALLLAISPDSRYSTQAQIERANTLSFLVWFVTAAYCFQGELLIRRRFFSKKFASSAKASLRNPDRLIDPVEVKLNQMRGDLGLHKMRNPQKKPDSKS
ncbi:hypothetical protein [Trichocoleus sp. FACHB-262]|uniref:hypothetical protein n=1 Tax=Trichocoleus sp. FACHB-262 TaxID=2692869 RepID=UPI001687C803|nr:hypothetical protein [Trichocoleus sp. FACHB-262]MBD2120440.1 hypothetical protein [Trichocoleus sp. FACHB-262]